MKNIIMSLGLLLGIGLAHADVMTKCNFSESGVTSCQANESAAEVLDVKCQPDALGQTACSGSYTDKVKAQLKMDCKRSKPGDIACNGTTSDGTSFFMSCLKTSTKDVKCAISDNQGESLTMLCALGKNGMPSCFGLDNQGTPHKINCTGKAGESTACITN